ncbi:hypothetical protein G6F68_014065 [Rhizopus microsporus]|nr:hypothetical protein G6F68_014065 [Rhizopus microsporus]
MESRRTFFKNQWRIKLSIFQQISHHWGPFSVDLFADRTTKLLPKYVSWLPDPGAIHTDAFTIPTPQGCAGTTSSGNSGGTLLAQCDLVSSSPTSSFDGSLAVASTVGSDNVSTNSSSVAPATLDALRVDIIRSKLERQNLNAQAVKDLLAERLADNATNQQYRRNQLRFLAWATRSNVSFTSFNPSDVVLAKTHSLTLI